MSRLFKPLSFECGSIMKNRFMLAPLTNTQSHADGRLSDDEYYWLTMRAEGGFAITMTCASHVQAIGQGFPGQLGCFSDDHLEGLSRLARGIKAEQSLAMVQIHHAGMRSPLDVIGERPVCPSDNEEYDARELTVDEIERLKEDFVSAAARAQAAGFDGVQIHGAHGYVLCQFLSPTINRRTDQYGGSLQNRSRIIFDIVDGIRDRCGPEFLLSVRLSPERFDLRLGEIIEVAQRLMSEGRIDLLDMSLWDCFKEPVEDAYKGRTLLSYFTDLDRGAVRLGVAGKIHSPADAMRCLEEGVDLVILGRAAILQHDFPQQVFSNPDFNPVNPPVSRDYLKAQGLGEAFIDYMARWDGFVENSTG